MSDHVSIVIRFEALKDTLQVVENILKKRDPESAFEALAAIEVYHETYGKKDDDTLFANRLSSNKLSEKQEWEIYYRLRKKVVSDRVKAKKESKSQKKRELKMSFHELAAKSPVRRCVGCGWPPPPSICARAAGR